MANFVEKANVVVGKTDVAVCVDLWRKGERRGNRAVILSLSKDQFSRAERKATELILRQLRMTGFFDVSIEGRNAKNRNFLCLETSSAKTGIS
jgi:hypothetical protein